MEKSGWYLIGYDIACPRRLARVHRFLKKEGLAVQKSLFFIDADQRQLACLFKGLANIIKAAEDDIRAYPISHPSRVWMSGGPLARFPLLTVGHPTPNLQKPVPWWRRWLPKK